MRSGLTAGVGLQGLYVAQGLVSTRREGKYIHCGLASHEVIQMMKTLCGLYCGAVIKRWT